MNEIEKRFYEAYINYEDIPEDKLDDDEWCLLKPDVTIDIYKADFVFNKNIVVEIDGHEHHKTKEQRFKDYQRERYFMKKGLHVIRFMGTEVYLDSFKCVQEMLAIEYAYHEQILNAYEEGLHSGKREYIEYLDDIERSRNAT